MTKAMRAIQIILTVTGLGAITAPVAAGDGERPGKVDRYLECVSLIQRLGEQPEAEIPRRLLKILREEKFHPKWAIGVLSFIRERGVKLIWKDDPRARQILSNSKISANQIDVLLAESTAGGCASAFASDGMRSSLILLGRSLAELEMGFRVLREEGIHALMDFRIWNSRGKHYELKGLERVPFILRREGEDLLDLVDEFVTKEIAAVSALPRAESKKEVIMDMVKYIMERPALGMKFLAIYYQSIHYTEGSNKPLWEYQLSSFLKAALRTDETQLAQIMQSASFATFMIEFDLMAIDAHREIFNLGESR